MYVNPKDSIVSMDIWQHKEWEPAESAVFQKELKVGDTVLDVGANIGYFTLLASLLVGPTGVVYAFEPDPENFQLLIKNISLNGFENVVAVNQAVGAKSGFVKLFTDEANKGDHRTFDSGEGRPSKQVAITALDDFFAKRNKTVDFLKMDIQGFEYQALQGMKKLLNRSKKTKGIVEFWPYGLEKAGDSPTAVLQELQKRAFSIRELPASGRLTKKIPPEKYQKLIKKLIPHQQFSNLFVQKES